MKTYLITGGAGFIGSHLIDRLLTDESHKIVCVDNFSNFYNPQEKRNNIASHLGKSNFILAEGDISNKEFILKVFQNTKPDVVVHLAARAGVLPSISNIDEYYQTNVLGTMNVLHAIKNQIPDKFIFASSSSVYGTNKKVPFSEEDALINPASPYSATKIAAEAICRVYTNMYDIKTSILRFFTVFGPRQRPDLAIRKFIEKILKNEEIVLYGNGETARDYTYIDDIINGIMNSIEYKAEDCGIFNLGNSSPVKLNDLVKIIEDNLGIKAKIKHTEMSKADVPITFADITKSKLKLNYNPETKLEEGIIKEIEWIKKES
ncbi:MAG: GDP-mannose 4,6-dehydratase [Bacteroidales bacterium]|nr:GDP-mannose 4,6-dehydratase [Bacteroidales bacterium]